MAAHNQKTVSRLTRRTMIRRTSAIVLSGIWPRPGSLPLSTDARGVVVGEPTAEAVAAEVFKNGGNAADAIVAAALAASVAAPHQTGIAGYGGSAMVAFCNRPVTAIDFNTQSPAAMQPDVFRPNDQGEVPARVNSVGWKAAGVPGILAGLQLVLDRFGTRSFRELVQPAIVLAREGVIVDRGLAAALHASARDLYKDPVAQRIFFENGEPLTAGRRLCNPDLAHLLTTLAERNSVASFYRGDIAQRIVEAFQKHDGLVTERDMAAYEAREVKPLEWNWGDACVQTAPPTAGGLTVLQSLKTMAAMKWSELPAEIRTHARVEALRWAWHDRLTQLGDPHHSSVRIDRLLSHEYAHECASQILRTVQEGKVIPHVSAPRNQGGTIHLSAADRDGNLAALTLTHGESFGARIAVDGLGLVLGHGMSRFDPRPDHPNGPGPQKRPLHNMCPTIVRRGGTAVAALGGRGGRRIPNALLEVLTQFIFFDRSLIDAVSASRIHTEGGLLLELEKAWPGEESERLAHLGYQVRTATSAIISAAQFDPEIRSVRRAMR